MTRGKPWVWHMLRNSKVSISKPNAPSTISSTRSATCKSRERVGGWVGGSGDGSGGGSGCGSGCGSGGGGRSATFSNECVSGMVRVRRAAWKRGRVRWRAGHLGDVAHRVQVVRALHDGNPSLLARDDGDRPHGVVEVLLRPVLDERADQRALAHARRTDHGHHKRRRDLQRHKWRAWRALGGAAWRSELERTTASTERSVRLTWYFFSCFSSAR